MRKNSIIVALAVMLPVCAGAQSPEAGTGSGTAVPRTLTLQECRDLALQNNRELDQSRTEIKMAGYDRKIALANYFPNISAAGAYMYNSSDINLLNSDMAAALSGIGTTIGAGVNSSLSEIVSKLLATNPGMIKDILGNDLFKAIMSTLNPGEITEMLNSVGAEIANSFKVDIQDVFVGAVSVTQPVFMGGKIVAANKMAALAEELSESKYDQKYGEILVGTDKAYWQIVSLANKKKLAESFSELLHGMERDVEISIAEGVATESDGLQIKVKANEADMMKTKAENGLALSRMLLCKQTGLPLDSDIVLADECLDEIPMPEMYETKDMEAVLADRPETRSLDLASRIYDNKYKIARADMMPKVALMANYLVSNPNPYNGFSKEWGGMFNAGVMVQIPIFHAFEATNKTRKAKAEATLYRSRYQDACEMINLEVSRLRMLQDEAYERLAMAAGNLASAEENLRTATAGFREGVVDTNTALAAQTAWLKAHSEYIDAGIELQINNVDLSRAEGRIYTYNQNNNVQK